MKKVIYCILILTFMISNAMIALAADHESCTNLEALGVQLEGSNEAITREEFAYLLSHTIIKGDIQPSSTSFSDVDESSPYSGYINVVSGSGYMAECDEGKFNPKEKVTPEVLYDAFVLATVGLNKDALNSINISSKSMAENYKLVPKSIDKTIDGYITVKGALEAVNTLVEAQYKPMQLTAPGSWSSADDYTSILARLNISVISGRIVKGNLENRNVTIEVDKNMYDSNPVLYTAGVSVSMRANENVDVDTYLDAPVYMWIDEDAEEILYVSVIKDVEVKYLTIAGINGVTDSDSEFSSPYIKYITFYDDQKNYSVDDSFTLRYQFKTTQEPVKLNDKYARVIFKNKKIISIETWDIIEGGLINDVGNEAITYTKGEITNACIRDINLYSNVKILINGRIENYNRLRVNCYFDYVQDDENLLLLVSERKITDRLVRYTKGTEGYEEFQIGNYLYTADKLCYIDSRSGYKANAEISDLSNTVVDAYFDISGRCKYIGVSSSVQAEQKKFMGWIAKGYVDEDDDSICVVVWRMEPTVQKRTYKVSDKVKIEGSMTIDRLSNIRAALSDANVFEFKLNGKNEISYISDALPYPGYGDAYIANLPSLSYWKYLVVDNKYLYYDGAPCYMLIDNGNGIELIQLDTRSINSCFCSGVSVKIFGYDEDTTAVRAMFLYGNTQSFYKSAMKFAFFNGKQAFYDEETDEILSKVEIVESAEMEYTISEEDASAWPEETAFITYYKKPDICKSQLTLKTYVTLEDIRNGLASGWYSGTVKKADSSKIYLTNGNSYFYAQHTSFYDLFVVKVDSKGKVTGAEISDLTSGDKIHYLPYYSGSTLVGIQCILIEEKSN